MCCVRVIGLFLIFIIIGLVIVIGLIYLEFNGKLNGLVVWVFLLNVFLIDCVFEVVCFIIVGEINSLLKIVFE